MNKLQMIAKKYKLDISNYDEAELIRGIRVEKEHDDGTNLDVVDNIGDLMKIAMAHLNELPDYYTRLEKMENESINESTEIDDLFKSPRWGYDFIDDHRAWSAGKAWQKNLVSAWKKLTPDEKKSAWQRGKKYGNTHYLKKSWKEFDKYYG